MYFFYKTSRDLRNASIIPENHENVLYCSFIFVLFSILDVEGLASQIIIDASDGVSGVIEWETTK